MALKTFFRSQMAIQDFSKSFGIEPQRPCRQPSRRRAGRRARAFYGLNAGFVIGLELNIRRVDMGIGIVFLIATQKSPATVRDVAQFVRVQS